MLLLGNALPSHNYRIWYCGFVPLFMTLSPLQKNHHKAKAHYFHTDVLHYRLICLEIYFLYDVKIELNSPTPKL